jgi:hypothetical protein
VALGEGTALADPARRSPHDGWLQLDGDFAQARFSWRDVGAWVGPHPGFELDLTFDEFTFDGCDSVTNLPEWYDDCDTAGTAEPDNTKKTYSVGSMEAIQIQSDDPYFARWYFHGGSQEVSEYKVGWQETKQGEAWLCVPFCGGGRCPNCMVSNGAGVSMAYLFSKSLIQQREWAWRDRELNAGNSRVEPNGELYWSGVPGRHSGYVCANPGTSCPTAAMTSVNVDLYLYYWNGSAWTEAKRSATATNPEQIEYTGPAGYYQWVVKAQSGSGPYQFGAAWPTGGPVPEPLSVALTASPSSSVGSVNDVDLSASVSGSAGLIDYTFYCDRSDAGTNITSPWSAQFLGIATNPKTAADICDYALPRDYTAKVIVKRGSSVTEKRTTISVTQAPSGGVPVVTTAGAASITQSSASLGMTVNPGGTATTVWFDWGTNTSVTQTTASQGVGSGTSTIPASVPLSGLSCGTTYFFRARAQNSEGIAATPGTIVPFSTAACGCGGSQTENLIRNGTFGADADFWSALWDFHATREFNDYHDGPGYAYLSQSNGSPGNGLNGELYQQVSIPSDATSATLRFWTKITTSEPTGGPAEDFLNATLQTSSGAFLASLQIYSNQNASSSYVQRNFNLVNFIGQTFRLHFLGVTNTDGQPTLFRIDDVSLEIVRPIGSAPVVTTQSADQVTATSARLNLTVDPNNAATTVWFDHDPNDSTPSTDTEHVEIGCGSQAVPASIRVFGLQCNTQYYFEANAENTHGDDDGSTLQFTTSACGGGGSSPDADTDPATDIGQTSATLTADVNANGLPTEAWFAWGASTALGQETPHVSVGSAVGSVDFSQGLSGLTCGSTYYFRNHASNAAGQDSGGILSFDTSPCDSASSPLLFASRQACSGTAPAILLGWTMPQEADPLVTIRRSDGQYVATVNTANQGPVLDVDSGLIFGNVYKFTVEAQVDGETLVSNELTVPIASDECRPPVVEGDLPHRPILWAKPAFCESGVAKVELFWTEATGAQTYSLQRIGTFMPSATYDNIMGTSFVDSNLTPGGGAVYEVRAHNSSGSVSSWNVGVIVPGTVCSTSGAPGSFSASMENLLCADSEGAATLHWGQSAGASQEYRWFNFSDHLLWRLNDDREDFVDELDHLDRGTVARAVVQAESATAPGKFRETYPVATLIPIDVCGAGTVPPSVGGPSASYIRADQAFVRASVTANGSDTTARVEWGTSTAYGLQTPSRVIGNGYGFVTLGEILAGLSCGTTYHFRVVASNANGTTQGIDGAFTTPQCPAVPTVTVIATDPVATESPITTGEFLIQRIGSTAGDVSVSYSVGGTATTGADHTLGTGSVSIPAGSASRTLMVFPLDDSLVESDETVIVTLLPQSQYTVGTPSSATVAIASDDVAGGGLIFSDGFESGDTCRWGFAVGSQSQCPPRSVSFAPKVDLQTGTEPLGLVVTDLDGDGRRDIAVTIYDHGNGERLSILRNVGAPGQVAFEPPVDVTTGRGPQGIAAGYLDGDGKPELVTANAGHQTVTVFKNSSTPGNMTFGIVLPLVGVAGTPHRVVINDFDRDGNPDLAITSNSGRRVVVAHHASDPNTIAFDYQREFGINDFLNDLAAADIDRDTKPDILVPRIDSGQLTILQNNSSPGNVQAGALSPLAAGTAPIRGIALGDLNNDLAVDVVVAAIGGVGIFRNSSSPGVFDLSRTDLPTGTNPDAVAIGDLDKDGRLDVVVANPSDNTISVLQNASTGTPIVLTPLALRPATGLAPFSLILGDVDGDSWLDIVVTNAGGNSISIILNTSGQE